MEFVQSFEEYSKVNENIAPEIEILDEGWISKFLTGFDNPEEKTAALEDFSKKLSQIEEKVFSIKKDMDKAEFAATFPQFVEGKLPVAGEKGKFRDANKWEFEKPRLMGAAIQNNFKGSLSLKKQPGDERSNISKREKVFVVYTDKKSPWEEVLSGIGAAAASAVSNTGKAVPPTA